MKKIVLRNSILFKIPEFPHISETFVVAQIATAIELGYTTAILTRKILTQNLSQKSHLVEKYDLIDKVVVEDYDIPKRLTGRILNIILHLLRYFDKWHQLFLFLLSQRKLNFTVLYQWSFYQRFRNFDIIHIQYGSNITPFDHLKKSGFKPNILCSFHGHDAFDSRFTRSYYKKLFKYSTAIIVNTNYLKVRVLELGCSKEKLFVIPVSVDTDFFISLDNDGFKKNRLITVSRLTKDKGVDKLLEVFKNVRDSDISVDFVIIGEGPYKSSLKEIAANLGIQNSIVFAGGLSPYEVKEWLTRSNLFLFASNSKSETQGLVIGEAMSCGLPVICMDNGGVKYNFIDGKSGVLIKNNSIEEMTNSVIHFLGDSDVRAEFSKNAREYVIENYSKKHCDKLWEALYSRSRSFNI